MDIWAWVDRLKRELRQAGNQRLVDTMRQIPNDVVNDRPDRVTAALPEAVAAARGLRNPWLEVFLRHWGMQNRVNNLSEGEAALGEATALLDFANQEETRDCPQSICVTQDMAICYANVDGPGWAEERLAVCSETLSRIDGSWPCFSCISTEYASALEDSGRAAEALDYYERQASLIEEAGEEVTGRFRWSQAACLAKAGRPEEALVRFDALDALHDDTEEEERISRAVDRALVLCALGRFDEALTVLPKHSDLTPGEFDRWTEAMASIATAMPHLNTRQTGASIQASMQHMVKAGSHRKAMNIALWHGRLAVLRGAAYTAGHALEVARFEMALLRKPFDMPSQVRGLADSIAALPAGAPLPVSPAEMPRYLAEHPVANPEAALEWLLAASRELPGDVDVALATCDALTALGFSGEAAEWLWEIAEVDPTSTAAVYRLLRTIAAAGDEAGIERLLSLVQPAGPAMSEHIKARWAFQQERWTDVGKHAAQILELDPDDHNARRMWAEAAARHSDFATATRLQKELLAADPELDGSLAWHLLSTASAMKDWSTVRDVAGRLGMQLSGVDGVVEEDWETILVLFEDGGEERRYAAQRTGPVTARVYQPAYAGDPQHMGDWVVFDAAPVDPPPADPEEARGFMFTFRRVHTISPGKFGRSWLLDGAHPGSDAWVAFRDDIRGRGWGCWDVTHDGYEIFDSHPADGAAGSRRSKAENAKSSDLKGNRGGSLPGILILVATPKAVPVKELHNALTELAKAWSGPLSWLALAEKAGEDVQLHRSIVERFDL